MAAHPDSKPVCKECKMHSYTGSALRGYQVTYRCKTKTGQIRQWSFSASSISRADAEICRFFNDENNTDYTIIKPNPVGNIGGCLPTGTTIHLIDGTSKPIELIDENDELACFELGTKKIVGKPVNGKSYTEDVQIIELIFSDTQSVKCSADQFIISAYGPIRSEDILEGAVLISSDDLSNIRAQNNAYIGHMDADVSNVYSIDIGRRFAFIAGENKVAMKCSTIGAGGLIDKY